MLLRCQSLMIRAHCSSSIKTIRTCSHREQIRSSLTQRFSLRCQASTTAAFTMLRTQPWIIPFLWSSLLCQRVMKMKRPSPKSVIMTTMRVKVMSRLRRAISNKSNNTATTNTISSPQARRWWLSNRSRLQALASMRSTMLREPNIC